MATSQTDADERARLEAKYEEIRQRCKPLGFIPYDCNPYLFGRPKLAYYGVAVTGDELYAFGERHGLCPEPEDKDFPEALRRYEVYKGTVEVLSNNVRWNLELHTPINPVYLYWTVTLYSNYTIPVRRLSEDDESEVIATILEELTFSQERDVSWYYDCFDGHVDMRLKPWTEPSEKVKRDMKKLYDGWGHECDL